jgi:hypothetical protein
MTEEPGSQFQAGRHANFLEDGTQMVLDCLNGNLQVPGDLGVRKSQGNTSRDRFLARCQRVGRSSGSSAHG